MGHKAFKQHFGIDGYIVSIDKKEKMLNIGSGYVPNLVSFNLLTGEIVTNENFITFLEKTYPNILNSTNEERLALIQSEDQFEHSIPVYTAKNGRVVETYCEALGYPNTTHDGEVMFENSHYTNKDMAVDLARRNLHFMIKFLQDDIDDLEKNINKRKIELDTQKEILDELNEIYPPSPLSIDE